MRSQSKELFTMLICNKKKRKSLVIQYQRPLTITQYNVKQCKCRSLYCRRNLQRFSFGFQCDTGYTARAERYYGHFVNTPVEFRALVLSPLFGIRKSGRRVRNVSHQNHLKNHDKNISHHTSGAA